MTEAPVAVVTGGASGIGAAVVTALRDRGHTIGTIDLSGETGRTTLSRLTFPTAPRCCRRGRRSAPSWVRSPRVGDRGRVL